jgi:hypothetical protein
MKPPRQILKAYRHHKYNAKPTTIDGIKFQSTEEGLRYKHLKLMEKTGHISDLELQPLFRLQDGFTYEGERIRPINYKADFRYKNRDGQTVVEDVKGFLTPEYRLKKKLFLKKYGSQLIFREV